MKELDSFTVERLEKISNSAFYYAGAEMEEIQALARIALSAKQAGWIKCIDYKPERETDVQVYCSDTNEQFVAFHLGNGEFQYAQHEDTSITCRPSHWMTLPAAPEKP